MFNNSPTVSVIISAKEQTEYLLQTINSVLQQTYGDFEILIFSDQRLAGIEFLHLLQDPRLKFVIQKNLNTFDIFNLGIAKAKGKYITFLNACYLWHPRKLQKQVFCLDFYPNIGLVHSWEILINHQRRFTDKVSKYRVPQCNVSNYNFSKYNFSKYNLSGWVESKILERNQINSCSVMVRRHCLEKIGQFNSELGIVQDWDMWIRLSRRYQFMEISEPLVFCQEHLDNIKEHWLVMETNLQKTIENAYANSPPELINLKRRSYAYASLYLAWQVLRNQEPDPLIANHYCRQALEHSLSIGFSRYFLQCSLAVMTFHLLRGDRFRRLWGLIHTIQGWLAVVFSRFKTAVNSFLYWILESDEQIFFRKNRRVKEQGKD